MAPGARTRTRAVIGWLLGFSVVSVLALGNGGYEAVARGRVGVAVWWVVLLGAFIGAFPRRVPSTAWVAVGLLGALALWTGVAASWSESAERSVTEFARVATYLGVLVLGVCVVARTGARPLVAGVASAIAFVAALAVLSRVHPAWFASGDRVALFGEIGARRLSYPLNYWNALGALVAMGVPLLLALSVGARTAATRAASVAALPVLALCMYLTISRGSLLVAAVAVAVLLMLAPGRWALLGKLALGASGAALLIAVARSQPALRSGIDTPQARSDGDILLVVTLLVCLGVGLASWGIDWTTKRVVLPAPPWKNLSRGVLRGVSSAAALTVVVAALALGVGDEIGERWQEFKAPPTLTMAGSSDLVSRLQAVNGTGRYQLWQAAIDANRAHRWNGIGPGAFEFWWTRNPTTPLFVRDAHNLYLETLAEAGIVGFALLVSLLMWVLIVAARRTLRAPVRTRLWLAAASATIAGFLTSAALDWTWEVAVAPAAMLLMSAVVVAVDNGTPRRRNSMDPTLRRAGLAVLSASALIVVVIPLAGAVKLRDSREAAGRGDLRAAVSDARSAERLQPYAASPTLQQALVLERMGRIDDAARAARKATQAEPTNWRVWLIRARISEAQGARRVARTSRARFRALNPRFVTEP